MQRLQEQHADLRKDDPVLVGVSGGRDSVALLDGLVSLGWTQLVVCHLNHGLRGRASGQDAIFVRRLAERLGLPLAMESVDAAAYASKEKQSIETAARTLRDKFFQQVMLKVQTRYLFLGHHADDQAETILANLCRGTSLKGLSGMALCAWDDRGFYKLRPLLEVSRAEVDAHIKTRGLKFREDASNASPEHRRNRLRHEVIPLLRDVFQRDVSEMLVRAGGLAERDEDYLQGLAADFLKQETTLLADGSLKISPELLQSHPAVLSRILLLWLGQQGVEGIGSRELDLAMQMLTNRDLAKVNLPRDQWLRRKAKRLFVEKAPV